MNKRLHAALIDNKGTSDEALRTIAHDTTHLFPTEKTFFVARKRLEDALASVADVFASMWEDERYIRVYETAEE